jgi:hypothetical protein
MLFSVKKVDAELADKMALVIKDEKGSEAMVKKGQRVCGSFFVGPYRRAI